MSYTVEDMMLDIQTRVPLKDIREKVRKDAIDECKEAFNEHLFDSPMMNPVMTRNEILLFLDQLKEIRMVRQKQIK